MKKRLFLTLVLVSISWVFAQEDNYSKYPGFIDFSRYFNIDPAHIKTEVEIKNPLLSLVASATKNEDKELSNLLDRLQLIKVYTFTTPSNKSTIIEQIEDLDKKMTTEKWDRFVKVREYEQNEVTNIYIKYDKDRVSGLTVLSLDNDETTLINIVGDIDMKSISKLSQQFNIPELDTLETE